MLKHCLNLCLDIDAKFGKLWVYFRKGLVTCPKVLREYLAECFGKKDLPFELVEHFVIPNFSSFLSQWIDPFEKYVQDSFAFFA